MTAWQLVKEGRPFTEMLTTNRFVMTTALKSLYIQIEMPADSARSTTTARRRPGRSTTRATPIPIEQALTTMTFSDEAPAITTADRLRRRLPAAARVRRDRRLPGHVAAVPAPARASRRSFPLSGNPTCVEHAVEAVLHGRRPDRLGVGHHQRTRRTPADRTPVIQPYDLPALRHDERADAVAAARRLLHDARVPGAVEHQRQQPAPRHRQPDAAGRARAVVHGSERASCRSATAGLDASHAVDGTECFGCHKSLDPMRQFWGNQLDYNDRNDFPARQPVQRAPRPTRGPTDAPAASSRSAT